jgi:hypothetical protein
MEPVAGNLRRSAHRTFYPLSTPNRGAVTPRGCSFVLTCRQASAVLAAVKDGLEAPSERCGHRSLTAAARGALPAGRSGRRNGTAVELRNEGFKEQLLLAWV